jgi:DNA-binding response OmpR family regulator
MSILLVEDDQALAAGLKQALKNEGFAVNHVARGADALNAIAAEMPEIVILDLGLPDIDGLSVLRQLRSKSAELPVLLLTARTSVDEKVAGLDCGADDYLAKPFEMEELLARLRVLSRRISSVKSNEISIDGVSLSTANQEVIVDGKSVELPRREYMLLKVLMENVGKVQTRDSLERKLYSWGEEVASNALEVHIHHLRKKLVPEFITTVRGVGYTVKAK